MKLPLPKPREMKFGAVALKFAKFTGGDPSRGFVPGYHFEIFDRAGIRVGHLNFRVGDTEHVRKAAGHIGFEIDRKHRGHGYAADACLAVGPWISRISGSVLITTDPGNLACRITLNKIGATYLDEVDVPENDPHFARGYRHKLRYEWAPRKGGD